MLTLHFTTEFGSIIVDCCSGQAVLKDESKDGCWRQASNGADTQWQGKAKYQLHLPQKI